MIYKVWRDECNKNENADTYEFGTDNAAPCLPCEERLRKINPESTGESTCMYYRAVPGRKTVYTLCCSCHATSSFTLTDDYDEHSMTAAALSAEHRANRATYGKDYDAEQEAYERSMDARAERSYFAAANYNLNY